MTKAVEREVTFEIDGLRVLVRHLVRCVGLFAIRFLAKYDRPRRGCEAGLCGTCESLVDGIPTRLCQLAVDVTRRCVDRQRFAAGSLTSALEISAAVRTTMRTNWS